MPANRFATPRARASAPIILVLCGLLPATGAWAGIVPLINRSVSRSISFALGHTDDITYAASPAEFEFYGLATSQTDPEENEWAVATFDLYVNMGSDCIQVEARCDAASSGSSAHNAGYGHPAAFFTVSETQEYVGIVQFTAHGLPGPNHWIRLTDVSHHEYWDQSAFGTSHPTGRIAPGSYWVEGAVDYTQTSEEGDGTSLSFLMCFLPCTPVITQQPQDVVAQPGTTVNVQLTASSAQPAAAVAAAQVANTYQWRRNLVNLANGGRISGATTDHLVITGSVYADTGRYDCVVTQGSIVEPSRQAYVTIQSSTDVEPSLGASDLQFAAPRPNPFSAGTTLQFDLARRAPVSLAIYDAQGRRVRSLLPTESMEPGSYSIHWDGRDADGARVASGVYFAQLTAGGTRVVRRAVLMTGER